MIAGRWGRGGGGGCCVFCSDIAASTPSELDIKSPCQALPTLKDTEESRVRDGTYWKQTGVHVFMHMHMHRDTQVLKTSSENQSGKTTKGKDFPSVSVLILLTCAGIWFVHTLLRKRQQFGSSRSRGINFIREQTEKKATECRV